jgi:hypothetical protein
MPCRECPDGHWECGEDRSELCQGGGSGMRAMTSMASEANKASIDTHAGGPQALPAAPGDWTKVGEFVARYEVYCGWGDNGKPIVKIVPVTQDGVPLVRSRR